MLITFDLTDEQTRNLLQPTSNTQLYHVVKKAGFTAMTLSQDICMQATGF